MTSKSISSRKSSTTETYDRPSRLRSQANIDSDTLAGTYYVAVQGDTPTKITLKRRHPAVSSKDLSKNRNSSSESDVKHSFFDDKTPIPSSKPSRVTATKEKCLDSSTQQVDLVPPTQKNIVNGSSVPSDLSTKASANDKKRAIDNDEKTTAKKPRISLDLQTVASKIPNIVITAASSSPQASSTSFKKACLASTILSFSWKSANALHQMQQHNYKFKQQITSLPAPSFKPLIVTAIPPMPPNWIDNYEDTIMSNMQTFKKYAIDPSTAEYQTIENMLQPKPSMRIEKIQKIVNPDLWKRFVNHRKEMLRSKTDDLNLLSELGLDERDVMRCTHLVLNQGKDAKLAPYSDNMSLLFHCTKTKSNLNSILSQGLDERLSSVFGGRLGKGIYFADHPQKALQYDGTGRILIFSVLLGDCLSVDHFPFKNALVREPEKHSNEMRNSKDLFFDSIVGRPAGFNEYVIYNRHQCCPLYEIAFEMSTAEATETKPPSEFDYEVNSLPSFAWIPDDSNFAVKELCVNWPFRAAELFQKMGSIPIQDAKYIYNEVAPLAETNLEQISTDRKLSTLLTFGFCDVDRNQSVLAKFNNDLYLALNHLLDDDFHSCSSSNNHQKLYGTIDKLSNVATHPNTQTSPSSDDGTATSDSSITSVVPAQLPVEVADFLLEFDTSSSKSESTSEMEECSICYNEYKSFDTSRESWKLLKCKHKLCLACHTCMLTTRSTISGVENTFVKCPYCHDITGIQIGTCPNIKMIVRIIPNSCEGYESVDTITINYIAEAGYQLNRTAFLPNNDEGKEVLRLLQIACDRRLCFSIGDSVTTGKTNVLVWGIHHKTSMRGGVLSYGYPDPEYMDRVRLELKSYGIQ